MLVEPEILRFMAYELILLLGRHRFAGVDMLIRVKALVAYFQKYVDKQSKKEIKGILRGYSEDVIKMKERVDEEEKRHQQLQFVEENLVKQQSVVRKNRRRGQLEFILENQSVVKGNRRRRLATLDSEPKLETAKKQKLVENCLSF
ncbi:hypothetical protein EZV62_026184 [Acer yangbiense]|uniref:Uncharacterized protein n=1 Tax=Acer yangbiense TaxID=1000413 RepID=A0A5C7GQU6_9ROSI|nr:hypothetical protein EZV62_026184 [Acer yangbiense]